MLQRLSDLGEVGLLDELELRGLVRNIGNDAAELDGVIVTQDALVEGVHFRLDWITWRDLGFRAAAVNLSDLAASGATPDGLLVSLGAPPETLVADVFELYEGIAEAGIAVVGGDTTRAAAVVVSITALGRSRLGPGRSLRAVSAAGDNTAEHRYTAHSSRDNAPRLSGAAGRLQCDLHFPPR